MPHAALQKTIEAAWEARDKFGFDTKGEVRDAVDNALDLLDNGKARVAEKNRRHLGRQSVAQEGRAAVVPPERHGHDPGRAGGQLLLGQGAA